MNCGEGGYGMFSIPFLYMGKNIGVGGGGICSVERSGSFGFTSLFLRLGGCL